MAGRRIAGAVGKSVSGVRKIVKPAEARVITIIDLASGWLPTNNSS
jgi:hypothetical protein